MKTLRTASVLAAMIALPALAGPTPPAPPAPMAIDLDFGFVLDDMLADAQSTQDHAQQWREYGEHMREYGERMRDWAHEFTDELQGSLAIAFSDRVGHGPVVKGAPYSAEAVSESRQGLADGNVISHENRSRVYRDGEGRTRQESYRKGELRSVYISDPVAHVTYTLLPGKKTAVVSSREERTPRARRESAAPEARVDRERTVIVDKDGKPGAREEVRVRVVRGSDSDADLPVPPIPPIAPVPPMAIPPGVMEGLPMVAPFPGESSLHFRIPPEDAQRTTTKVGPKDIEGVRAEGVSTVWTIPAGKIGNKNPINITRETWTSPDLHVTVLSRYNDPRSGESIYRLASIKRGEPSADLFKLPEGYKVRERHGITPAQPAPPAPPAPAAPPRPRG
ncbi:MAG TPA: hypothetical protein VLL50_14665 [Usitatibacter sp.]|nr:hypothetical protein [Usitatibacter sp.]